MIPGRGTITERERGREEGECVYWTRNLNIHEAIPGHLCPAAMLRLHYGDDDALAGEKGAGAFLIAA